MEKWIQNILNQERKKRKRPLEVKTLNGNPYLYLSTTRWDKSKKKIKKVTEYIGRITKDGLIERNANAASVSKGLCQISQQRDESVWRIHQNNRSPFSH